MFVVKFFSNLSTLCLASVISDSAFDIFSRIVTIKLICSRKFFNALLALTKSISSFFDLTVLEIDKASNLAT